MTDETKKETLNLHISDSGETGKEIRTFNSAYEFVLDKLLNKDEKYIEMATYALTSDIEHGYGEYETATDDLMKNGILCAFCAKMHRSDEHDNYMKTGIKDGFVFNPEEPKPWPEADEEVNDDDDSVDED